MKALHCGTLALFTSAILNSSAFASQSDGCSKLIESSCTVDRGDVVAYAGIALGSSLERTLSTAAEVAVGVGLVSMLNVRARGSVFAMRFQGGTLAPGFALQGGPRLVLGGESLSVGAHAEMRVAHNTLPLTEVHLVPGANISFGARDLQFTGRLDVILPLARHRGRVSSLVGEDGIGPRGQSVYEEPSEPLQLEPSLTLEWASASTHAWLFQASARIPSRDAFAPGYIPYALNGALRAGLTF